MAVLRTIQCRAHHRLAALLDLDRTARAQPGHGCRKTRSRARTLATLDRSLGETPFIAGSDFTIADVAVYAYNHRAGDCGFSLPDYPAFAAWTDRVRDAIGPGHPVHPYGIDPHSGA